MDKVELYYRILSAVYSTCAILFTAGCLMVWVKPFLTDGGKNRKVWYIGAAYAVVMLIANFMPYYVDGALVYGMALMAAFLVMRFHDRSCGAQKLFLALAFYCVRWSAWRIVSYISNQMALLETYLFPDKNVMFWFGISVVNSICDCAVGTLLMYGGVKCLLWSYGRRREQMSVKEFLLLAMPSVSSASAYVVLRYYAFIYERDAGQSVFDLHGGHDLIMLFHSVLNFVVIVVTTYIFRQWKNEQEEDGRKKVFSKQMQDLEQHIAEAEQLYRDMRMLRHDMGNHMMTLEQLYDKGAYEEAEQYARALKQEMQTVPLETASGNPVTDVILSERKKELEEKEILFRCDFHYPQDGRINAFDVSVILNNGLTNAIEAIERERAVPSIQTGSTEWRGSNTECGNSDNMTFVSLRSDIVRNMFIIEIVNSYSGEWVLDEPGGLPMTSKAGIGHGYGLANIRHVAQKYYGDMEISKEVQEGQACCVLRVMLQME